MKPVVQIESVIRKRPFFVYNIIVCILILICSCLASIVLGKDGNWDLLNYHFYNPAALLTGRIGFDFFPAQRQNWLNPLMDIPTYILIMTVKPWMVGAVMGIWHGVNLIFVYLVAKRVFFFVSPFVGALLATLATLLATTGSIVRGLWGSFTGDLTVSVFVLAALAMFLTALIAEPGKRRIKYIFLSGLLMGMGTGLRTTVAVHAIPLVALTVFFGDTIVVRLRAFILYIISCIVGFVITYGYWALFLQARYGSPFFPYYNAIFRSPLIAPTNLVDLRWMPPTLIDHLLLPFTYFFRPGQGDVIFKDWRPGIAYAALLVLGVSLVWRFLRHKSLYQMSWHKAKPMAVLLLFFAASWAIWQVEFSYYRYLAPLELIFPILILSIAYLLIPRLKVLPVISLLLLVVLMRTTTPIRYERGAWGDDYFDVKIPAQIHLGDSQVLIVDADRPLAYFIPFFPASTQVLRLTSNLDGALDDAAHAKLKEQRDQQVNKPLPKFVMYVESSQPSAQNALDAVLAHYGLQRQQRQCATITSSFSNATLCPVTTMSAPSGG